MGRIATGVALLVSALLTMTSPAPALDLERVLTGYSLSSWAERDGVPIGPVWALAQDADGYLWVGTNAGLLRFDGARYVTADTGELVDVALLEGGSGRQQTEPLVSGRRVRCSIAQVHRGVAISAALFGGYGLEAIVAAGAKRI